MSQTQPSSPASTGSTAALWLPVIVGFGFAPLLLTFFGNLWKQPEYQYFPQALAAAGFLAWERLREVARPFSQGQPVVTIVLALLSFVALSFGVLIWSPWMGAIAAFLGITFVLWDTGGRDLLRKMVPALVMLLTIIPLPLGLDARLGLLLREVATVLSSRVLDLLGVIHSVDGNVIELPGQRLLVEEACSGINSLLFVVAFSLFYLLWRRRKFWTYLIGVPTAVACVLLGNVVRISLGAWLLYRWGFDILTGWKHELLSVLLVIGYVLLVISMEHLLTRGKNVVLAHQSAARPRADYQPRKRVPGLWILAISFAGIGVLSGFKALAKSREAAEPLQAAKTAFDGGLSIPEQIGDWSRERTGPPRVSRIETLGLSSVIWNFERPGMNAVVAFDYPIWKYHDVAECYTSTGWKIARKELVSPGTGKPSRVLMDLTKDPGVHGTLWFGTINERGEWVDKSTLARNFFSRLGLMGTPEETTFRVQVLVVGNSAPDPAMRAAASQLFDGAAEALEHQVRGQRRE